MNLAGLETFGDALGAIPGGSDTYFVNESFSFNSGMFISSTVTGGQFSGLLKSLNQGPAVGFTQFGTISNGTNTLQLTDLPSGLAAEVVAYLGHSTGGNDVTVSQGLLDYAANKGIDPSQLILDKANSYVKFNYPNSGNYIHNADFMEGKIVYNYFAEYDIPITPGAVYGLGRQKVTENMTPVPTDRFIFDYSYFHNVPVSYGKMAVNRFTPGFEKTFLKKKCSIEMRLPFATTLDNTLYTNNQNEQNVLSIGDMTVILKWLVFKQKKWAMTLGLGISLPLADDTHLIDSVTNREVICSKHKSFHLMPYLGLLYIPNDRLFFQGYFQIDATTGGDSTYVADLSDPAGERMVYAGKTRERTYAYTSLGAGYWLYKKSDDQGNLKRGVNLMGELHWTQSLDRAEGVHNEQGNYIFNIGRDRKNYSVLDLTLGTRFMYNEKSNIGLGYSVPLSNNRQFDGELRLTFNRYF